MKRNPTVSVIIPTYNRAHLVGRAIQSVLDQTYQDFELIVVDDGSTDNTEDIIKEFQRKDDRIKYLKHEKNKGGSAARNTGIKNSVGKYIAFQDSDDEWLPEKLEKQMRVFENAPAKIGVVYTGFWRIEGNKKIYIPSDRITRKEGDIHDELLNGNFVTTQSIVARKKCFEKAGMFDESLPRLQDWELVIRLSKYYDFKCIDEPLLTSPFTPDSISANNDALIKVVELILAKHFKDFDKHKKILSKHYFNIGLNLCLNNNFEKGRNYLIKAISIYPYNIQHLLITLVSFLGQSFFYRIVKIYRKLKNKFILKSKQKEQN
ncbi:MAG: glycosyltransferase [Candidatus Caldatribacteriota bacterium]